MGLQLHDFISLNCPNVDDSIFAARHNELGVGGEGTLDDGSLIDEAGQLVLGLSIEGVKDQDNIVGEREEEQVSTLAELHDLDIAVVLQLPVRKWARLAFLLGEQADSGVGFVHLLLSPGRRKDHPSWVKAGNWVGRHIILFQVKQVEALRGVRVEVPEPDSVILAGGDEGVVQGAHHEVGDPKLGEVYVSLWPVNDFMTRLSWMDQ